MTDKIELPIGSYSAETDDDGLTDDTLLCDGETRLGDEDVYSIDDCALTPGDPSPVARYETGELAYIADSELLRMRGYFYPHITQGDLANIIEALGVVTIGGDHERHEEMLALQDRLEKVQFEAGEG